MVPVTKTGWPSQRMTGTKKIQNVQLFIPFHIEKYPSKCAGSFPVAEQIKFIKCSLGQNDNSGFNNRQRSRWIQRSSGSISLSSIPGSGSRGKFLQNLLQENWNSQLHSFSFSRPGAQNRCGALLLHRPELFCRPAVCLHKGLFTHTHVCGNEE